MKLPLEKLENSKEQEKSIKTVLSHSQEPKRKKKKEKKCDKKANSKRFQVGQWVCFSNSQRKMDSEHRKSSGFADLFLITKVFPCGALDLRDGISGRKVKVNGQWFKQHCGGEVNREKTSISLTYA